MRLTPGRIAQHYCGDWATFRRKLARSWVAWRDGSMAASGGTGGSAINPRTGAVETGPMTMDFMGLRFGFTWDQISQLCPAMTGGQNGLTSRVLSSLDRTLIEDSANTSHYNSSASGVSLTNGVLYNFQCVLRRSGGSRHAALYASVGGNRAGFVVNMDTGVATASTTGTGAVASLRTDAVPGGWRVSCSISASAWGGTPTLFERLSNSGTDAVPSYTGDGASGIVYTGVTLSLATDFAPLLAEGITRTADSFIWTTPAVLPQNCEISHLLMQPYADGDMGITRQTWFRGNAKISALERSSATVGIAYGDDAVGTKSANTPSRTLPNRATLAIQRFRRTPASLSAGYGATMGTETAITAPHESVAALAVGYYSTPGRASRGANTLIITPGGCTQAEREAEARLFHLRPVSLRA
jgi:hypothetical protein